MADDTTIYPETVAEAVSMPVEGLRVLRELMDAARANDPLKFLVRAHRELEEYIGAVRESYINSASGLLSTAGAGADLEVMHPFPQHGTGGEPPRPNTKPTVTGFQPNKEEN